jgi:hypothetical protein
MTGLFGDEVSIASDELRVTVSPRIGGTITAITHLGIGLSILGEVPWDPVDAPIGRFSADDEAHWLSRYGGGWPVLFPNGGDACTVDGVFHGFHGEASIAPWRATVSRNSLELTRRFFTAPVEMRRELRIERDLLLVREHLQMKGSRPLDVMWGHHPTFGSDLLASSVEMISGARRVTADEAYDPPRNPLVPGAIGEWPVLRGKHGPYDLSRPAGPLAAMAYLHDFKEPWAAIRRLDNAVAAALSWTIDRFPFAWLWYELGGTAEAPWHGRGRLIGIEPNTTRPANGLRDAQLRGSPLLRLKPGAELTAEVRLHVFRPAGRITKLDGDGRAILSE